MMGEAVYSTTGRWRPGQPQRGWVGLRAAGVHALLALLMAIGTAAAVRAESTSERSGSILIFPKVVYDSSRDTLIQISNTSNSMVHAHCFYVNAAPLCL